MSILLIPQSLKGKNFAVFEIDSCFCDYSGASDMLSTNIPDVKITIADNPKEWMAENLGMNEVPLAYVVNGKVTRTFFAQARGLKLKPRKSARKNNMRYFSIIQTSDPEQLYDALLEKNADAFKVIARERLSVETVFCVQSQFRITDDDVDDNSVVLSCVCICSV